MQFHLNGFYPGDPRISDPQDRVVPPPIKRPLPKEVDVMIVGCGPAGLNLAAQLAQFGDISTCIVDMKDDRLLVGQADGIACRTMELFQAFGFADQIAQEAYWVNETAFWKPDPNNTANIARSSRIQDVEEDLSEFPHVIINQARVHDQYLSVMKQGPAKLEPHYSRKLVGLTVEHDSSSHPVTLTFERMVTHSQYSAEIETVKAKYVVGCDGARSQVRQLIGKELVGDSINQAWGVMDVLLATDFPDIRLKSAIHSSHEGNMLIIPREGGYMVRLYIELDKLNANQRIDRSSMSPDILIDAANRIMQPYTLNVKQVAWWSVYEIGQRLTTAFDNAEEGRLPSVFLAGDACHTHSPKAGQGLNTSVNDTWNLGWKLVQVLKGLAKPELLNTYSQERQKVAQQLIDFDREFSKMFSAKPKSDAHPDGVDPAEFQRYFQQFGRFTAGTAIHYAPEVIGINDEYQTLARGLTIGMRFHSAPVVRVFDAKPVQLGHCIKADARWRIFLFASAADIKNGFAQLHEVCQYLENDPNSPVKRFTPADNDMDSLIDVRAIIPAYHRDVNVSLLPSFLIPVKGELGLQDFEKVYALSNQPADGFFAKRGIDTQQGCAVVVRPDQYVMDVLPLAQLSRLTQGFERWMK